MNFSSLTEDVGVEVVTGLVLEKDISQIVYDPYVKMKANFGKSSPLFFHGTTKENYEGIEKMGLIINPLRPTFTLSPEYAFFYCRKSESYLRKLIREKSLNKLKEETNFLIKNRVITPEELEDTKCNWWITKADAYYFKTMKVSDYGVLLAYKLEEEEVTIPPEMRMFQANYFDKQVIFGRHGYWRRRQAALSPDSGHVKNIKEDGQIVFHLSEDLVNAVYELGNSVENGTLNESFTLNNRETLSKHLVYDQKGIRLKKNEIIAALADQIIESRTILLLRDIFMAETKHKGEELYSIRDGNFIEDPRWNEPEDKVDFWKSSLRLNSYGNNNLAEYVNQTIELIEKEVECKTR